MPTTGRRTFTITPFAVVTLLGFIGCGNDHEVDAPFIPAVRETTTEMSGTSVDFVAYLHDHDDRLDSAATYIADSGAAAAVDNASYAGMYARMAGQEFRLLESDLRRAPGADSKLGRLVVHALGVCADAYQAGHQAFLDRDSVELEAAVVQMTTCSTDMENAATALAAS